MNGTYSMVFYEEFQKSRILVTVLYSSYRSWVIVINELELKQSVGASARRYGRPADILDLQPRYSKNFSLGPCPFCLSKKKFKFALKRGRK